MSWPHPSALGQQQRILAGQSRFPPARSRDEDNSSVLSWNTAQNEADDPADGEDPLLVNEGMVSMGINRLDPISEAPGASQSATTAPALQAARNFVDHTNETPVDRKLRKQQEQAHRRGKKGLRWVQLGAHNAINVELPNHIQQVGSGTGERSILILDHRDQRLQSPFQGWLVDEILWLYDVLRISALWKVGHCHSQGVITPGVPTLSLASHEGWLTHMGRCEGETWRRSPYALRVSWIPLGLWHDSPSEPHQWHADQLFARDAFRAYVFGHDLSRVACGRMHLGGRRQDLCHLGGRRGGRPGLSALSCGSPAGQQFISRCVRLGCRSHWVSILECGRSPECCVQFMLGATIVACGIEGIWTHARAERVVVQEEVCKDREPWSGSPTCSAGIRSCTLDSSDRGRERRVHGPPHFSGSGGKPPFQHALDLGKPPVQERQGHRGSRFRCSCNSSSWSKSRAPISSGASDHRRSSSSAGLSNDSIFEGHFWTAAFLGRAIGSSKWSAGLFDWTGSGSWPRVLAHCWILGAKSAYIGATSWWSDGLLGYDACRLCSASGKSSARGSAGSCTVVVILCRGRGAWRLFGWIRWGQHGISSKILWTSTLIWQDRARSMRGGRWDHFLFVFVSIEG